MNTPLRFLPCVLLPRAIVPGFLGAVTLLATASPAHADGLDVRIHGKRASIGVSIGETCRPRYVPAPICPPRPIGYAEREWIPGHYEIVTERVWVPGREERVWIPPVYEWRRDACGRLAKVLVSGGTYEVRCTPGAFELRERRVWVEGGWRVRTCR